MVRVRRAPSFATRFVLLCLAICATLAAPALAAPPCDGLQEGDICHCPANEIIGQPGRCAPTVAGDLACYVDFRLACCLFYGAGFPCFWPPEGYECGSDAGCAPGHRCMSSSLTPDCGDDHTGFCAGPDRDSIIFTTADSCTVTPPESDSDGDGVADDGDGSGTVGDQPCTAGETDGCDDNCISIANPDQKDSDGDGVGDACDVLPPRCGDGHTDPGEECDDGNGVDTDSCTNACTSARCGDGIVEDENEDCDPGLVCGDTDVLCIVNQQLCTSDCRDDGFSLYRIRLGLRSCNVDRAESGDDLWVSLRPDHKVWLNRPIKDLHKGGKIEWYDVLPNDTVGNPPEIRHLRDIEFLEIGKTGTDGWCVKEIALKLNQTQVFDRVFRDGHFLDSDNGQSNEYRVELSELRNTKGWDARLQAVREGFIHLGTPLFPPKLPVPFNRGRCEPTIKFRVNSGWVKSVVEAAVGHGLETSLASDTVDWDDDSKSNHAVEVSKTSDKTATEVDLDLEIEFLGHPSVDVNFELVWACGPEGDLQADVRHLEIDIGGYGELANCQPLPSPLPPIPFCITPIIESVAEHIVRGQLGQLVLLGEDNRLVCVGQPKTLEKGGFEVMLGPSLPVPGCPNQP